MRTKELTVYKGRGANYNASQIVLQGKWLQGLGFSIGDKVTIICEQDRIVIINPTVGQALNGMEEV